MPSSPFRRRLRALGHPLDPIVQVGKNGVTDMLLAQLSRAISDHELVKVRLGTECPDDRFVVAAAFAELPGVSVAQILGRTILLYKKRPKNPKIEPDTRKGPEPKGKKPRGKTRSKAAKGARSPRRT